MFWALLCIHWCDCILCSGPSFACTFATVSYALGFLLYADLGLCSVFFVYALQPYPGLWVLFCMHFRTVSDTPVFFCIRFYGRVPYSGSSVVCIFTTVSYAPVLLLYSFLRPYLMIWVFRCMHRYDCILCAVPSFVCMFTTVSYALDLLWYTF